jgi:hypothetical protein
MPLKVYPFGESVALEKDANPVFYIPVDVCAFVIQNEIVYVFNNSDRTIQESDTIDKIQDQTGTQIGTNIQDVAKYLNEFIFIAGSVSFPVLGEGEENTAQNVGTGAGLFKQKTGEILEFKSLIGGTGTSLVVTPDEITINAGGVPIVADQVERDSLYPSPANEFQVFNRRQGLIECFDSTFGLWLSANMNVCIEDTTAQIVQIRKITYLDGSSLSVSGQEYPIVDYVGSSANRNVTNGVIVQKGNAISPTENFISVAHFGKYYIDYQGAVSIGDNVYSTTNNSGNAQGSNFAQSGSIGQAIENSGSNPSFPNSVFASLQNRR